MCDANGGRLCRGQATRCMTAPDRNPTADHPQFWIVRFCTRFSLRSQLRNVDETWTAGRCLRGWQLPRGRHIVRAWNRHTKTTATGSENTPAGRDCVALVDFRRKGRPSQRYRRHRRNRSRPGGSRRDERDRAAPGSKPSSPDGRHSPRRGWPHHLRGPRGFRAGTPPGRPLSS